MPSENGLFVAGMRPYLPAVVPSVGTFLGTGTKLVAMLLGQARLTGNKMVMSHGSRQELTAMGPFMSALKRGS